MRQGSAPSNQFQFACDGQSGSNARKMRYSAACSVPKWLKGRLVRAGTTAEHEIHFLHRRHGRLSTGPRDRNCACCSGELGTLERRSSEHQCNGKCTVEGIPCTSSIDCGHRERVHLLTQTVFG